MRTSLTSVNDEPLKNVEPMTCVICDVMTSSFTPSGQKWHIGDKYDMDRDVGTWKEIIGHLGATVCKKNINDFGKTRSKTRLREENKVKNLEIDFGKSEDGILNLNDIGRGSIMRKPLKINNNKKNEE